MHVNRFIVISYIIHWLYNAGLKLEIARKKFINEKNFIYIYDCGAFVFRQSGEGPDISGLSYREL